MSRRARVREEFLIIPSPAKLNNFFLLQIRGKPQKLLKFSKKLHIGTTEAETLCISELLSLS